MIIYCKTVSDDVFDKLETVMKFDSDTERRFALFLDANSEKWFKLAWDSSRNCTRRGIPRRYIIPTLSRSSPISS